MIDKKKLCDALRRSKETADKTCKRQTNPLDKHYRAGMSKAFAMYLTAIERGMFQKTE